MSLLRISLLLLSAALLPAQLGTVVEGIVEDQAAGRMAGVKVTLRNTATNREVSTTTGSQGEFRMLNAFAGRGEIVIDHPGFAKFTRQLDVAQNSVNTVTLRLTTGSVSQEVNVSASSELLQPTRATNTSTLTSQQIENLPAASRNYTHLIVADAGVAAPLPDRTGRGMNIATAPGAQGDDGTQSLNPSVNGARPTNNSLMINGVDATNMMNAGGSLGNNINVPLDALEAVEVQTALYSATTGRNGGANIQMVTRSGTNQFRGSVSHFFQNEKFNANEFFLNRGGSGRPKFRRNESYVGFGGPIVRDKTFFYAAVQRTDFLTGFANRAIANTAIPEGLGDVRTRESIAQVANQWLQSGQADDARFAANLLTAVRRFPAAQIPGLEQKFFSSVANPANPLLRNLTANDIHPVAINVLNQKRNGQFLLPSASRGTNLLRGNGTYGREVELIQSFPTFFNGWSGSGTIEHNFSSADRLRLNYVKSSQFVEEAFGWANSSPSPTQGLSPSYVASLSHIHTFGSNWINDLRGGFFELYNTRISRFRDITNSSLGIFNPLEQAVGGLASLMPTIDIVTQRGASGIGNAWDFFDRQRSAYVSNTVSRIIKGHTLQFGAELRRNTIAGEYMARTNGDLDYDSWVFFFTGHGAAGGGSDLDQGDTRRNYRMWDTGLFFQDDWRVRKGLTINAGIRWDYYGWPVELLGRMGTYYTADQAKAAGVQPGYHIAQNHLIFQPNFDPLKMGLVVSPYVFPLNLSQVHKAQRDSIFPGNYKNFAPRIGFAWQPTGFSRMVIRGGYGIYYERPQGSFKSDLQLSAPFFVYQNVPAPENMADPYPRLNINPFQIPLNVTIARDGNGTPSFRRFDGTPFPANEPFAAKNFSFIDPFIQIPYTQQWTFNIQYEPLKGNLIDVRYVGTRGVGLFGRINLAQPLDPRVTPINGFNNIRNNAGALINPDFFVPSEFFGLGRQSGFRQYSNYGQSAYHSLQMNYRRTFQRGLLINAAYTWSKVLDTISTNGGTVEHDARNIANNKGPADFDRTHRVTMQWVYQLPRMRDAGFAKHVLGGWGLNGMMTIQSGSPFTAIGANTANAFFAQVARVRVDFAPGLGIDDARKGGRVQDRLTSFFNPAAFANSEDRWGNAGRNILRGPWQRQFDFAMVKNIPVYEQISTELRWELFNAFNQATFSNPAATLPAAGFGTMGQITQTIGGPRTMQVALRVRF
jgi:outer membrane receptor protein involved in Fe transport